MLILGKGQSTAQPNQPFVQPTPTDVGVIPGLIHTNSATPQPNQGTVKVNTHVSLNHISFLIMNIFYIFILLPPMKGTPVHT